MGPTSIRNLWRDSNHNREAWTGFDSGYKAMKTPIQRRRPNMNVGERYNVIRSHFEPRTLRPQAIRQPREQPSLSHNSAKDWTGLGGECRLPTTRLPDTQHRSSGGC